MLLHVDLMSPSSILSVSSQFPSSRSISGSYLVTGSLSVLVRVSMSIICLFRYISPSAPMILRCSSCSSTACHQDILCYHWSHSLSGSHVSSSESLCHHMISLTPSDPNFGEGCVNRSLPVSGVGSDRHVPMYSLRCSCSGP